MKLLLLASVFAALGLWTKIDKNHTPFPKKNYIITAQNNIAENNVNLSGILIKQAPSKSLESFCSAHPDGNSYLLKKSNGQTILLDLADFETSDLKTLINKKVYIKGYFYQKNRVEEDDNMQRPIEPIAPDFNALPNTKGGMQSLESFPKISNYNCEIFYVEELSY